MKKLIIIPAFNEEKSLLTVIADIRENAPDYDYVVINDASTDRTKKICEEHQLHYLDLASNLGIGGAVQTGYQYALYEDYDLAVQLDGDGQHEAASLKDLERELKTDENHAGTADLVIGSRFINKEGFQSTGMRRIGISFLCWLIKCVTGQTVTDPSSGLRMGNKNVIRIFAKWYPWDYPEPESLVTIVKDGLVVREVPVIMRKRQGGKSSIGNPLKAVYYMIKVSCGILIEGAGRRNT